MRAAAVHTAPVADARATADAEEAIAIAVAGLQQRTVRELLELRKRALDLEQRQRLGVAEVAALVESPG